MAVFFTIRYLIVLSLLVVYFRITVADSKWTKSSFYFKNFTKDSNFESQLALYGDSKVVNGELRIEITGSSVYSAGGVMYKKPIKLIEGKPASLVSFSTHFSFFMSPDNGDGLALFMVPIDFPVKLFDGGLFGLLGERKLRFLSVKFDASKDQKYGDVNGNHVGIDVSSFIYVKMRNISSINLVLNSGEKLQAWIDYEAGSRRLEVRLSKLGNLRPVDPFLSYSIDLSQMWKQDEVFVGLSSSNGNSLQKCNVCSWSFKLRQPPHWMHSQPLDPEAFVGKTKGPTVNKRNNCFLRVFASLVFGTACGVLGALFVLFVWAILVGNRRPIVPVLPEEYAMHPVEFEHKKFKVVVDVDIGDNKK